MIDAEILEHPLFSTPRIVVNTRAALSGFVQGQFTFTEFLMLLRRRFKNPDTQEKFINLQRQGMEKFIDKDGSVNLYGHALYPILGDPKELIHLIDQIICADQYRTDLIKDGDVVIDAGANKGVFSVMVAHKFPHAKIYAFEPVRETMVTLKRNTAPYPNVLYFELGLGDVKALKPMKLDAGRSEGNAMEDSVTEVPDSPGKKEIRNVPVTTVDDFVAEHPLARVDFIKMDVEGYEGKVLLGAAKTIQRFKPTIVMSAYHTKRDVQELPSIMERIQPGYRIKLERRKELDLVCRYPGR